MAGFDYNWTLVRPISGRTHPVNERDVQWLNANVVGRLRGLYQAGFAIVVLTNQRVSWATSQIRTMLSQVGVPLLVGVATKSQEKKPNRFLFDTVVTWPWDTAASFYVGDALGRPGDWSASDRDFAAAIGMIVRSPEDVFSNNPRLLAVQPKSAQELVIVVGYPGAGKSTLAHNLFAPNGYTVISGARPLPRTNAALKTGASVVVDATNPSRQGRKEYVRLANAHRLAVRCVYFAEHRTKAMSRNRLRAEPVPDVAYDVYDSRFDEPLVSEGFVEVITV